jgi:hypothetical protein
MVTTGITYKELKKGLERKGHTVDMPVTGKVWVNGKDRTVEAVFLIENNQIPMTWADIEILMVEGIKGENLYCTYIRGECPKDRVVGCKDCKPFNAREK